MIKISTIAELMVKIGADTKGLTKGLSSVTTSATKVVTGLAKIGAAGALALGGALVAATASGIQGIIAMDNQVAQLNAVLKSTGGAVGLTAQQISGMATALQLTTKFAEEDTLAAQNMLLTFTNIGKDVFPRATTALLDLATAMGTDAKSSAIQLGKALNDPSEGISALTRVGVVFTDEQKKLIKALQESGDMAGAQAVILKELEKEYGGSAVAAGDTLSGQLIILKNAFGEVTESLATKFLPYLEKFIDWVSSNMPTIQAIFSKAFDIVAGVLKVTYDFIKDNIIPIFVKLYDWIKPNIPAIKDFIKTAFDVIGDVFKAAGGFITSTVIPALQKLWDWIQPKIPKIKDTIKTAFDVIGDVFKAAGGFITDTLIPTLQKLWDWIKPNIPGIKDAIKTAFDISTEAIKKTIKAIEDIIAWGVKYQDALIPLGAGIAASVFSFKIYTLAIEAWTLAVGIATGASTIFKGAIAFITGPVGLVIAAIGILVAAGVTLWKNWDTIKEKAESLFPTIPEFFRWPTIPGFNWPTLPTFLWPTLSAFHWPTLKEFLWPTLPAFHWPTLPQITLPTIKWPTLSQFLWPTIPKLTLPSINWPTLPMFFWPTIPKLTLPTISWPHIKTPHFFFTGSFSLVPPRVPYLNVDWYAKGVTSFAGGLAGINERGGEIVNLPQGTNIIPHDVSMQIAKSVGSRGNTYNLTITGNKISNDYDVNRIADLIVRRLKTANV